MSKIVLLPTPRPADDSGQESAHVRIRTDLFPPVRVGKSDGQEAINKRLAPWNRMLSCLPGTGVLIEDPAYQLTSSEDRHFLLQCDDEFAVALANMVEAAELDELRADPYGAFAPDPVHQGAVA